GIALPPRRSRADRIASPRVQDRMANYGKPSPPAPPTDDDLVLHGLQQRGTVRRVFINSQGSSDLSQLVADVEDRIASRRRLDSTATHRIPRRRSLDRMTNLSYPSLPPSHYHWGAPGFPRPVVIPKQLPPGDERAYVHEYYPPTQTVQGQHHLPHEDGATKVVCLTEMLSSHHLLEDDEFYGRFLEDVDEEACVFSNLVNVVVPRPGPSNVDPVVAGVGRVFLEYSCLDSSNL
uniref:Uncharacterized protein n=2 Tax=Triticinae TaxID=1648030 RepID=A0A453LL16_AEGTS